MLETERGGVARILEPAVRALAGDVPLPIHFWDGSSLRPSSRDLGAAAGSTGAIFIRSPNAVRRLLWAPGELGAGRAYVAGEIDFDGDVFEVVRALRGPGHNLRHELAAAPAMVRAARTLGLIGRPPAPPPEEARQKGRRHSAGRDADAIRHHYDVGNDFYRLVLGPSMTYSCARFVDAETGLEDAQAAKHELICRKLGLHRRPDMRLLDVGCGWGSLAIHAARQHRANVVGITISREQADLAQKRVADAGVGDRVEIRLLDYRELRGERFDAISSVGMFEHVGRERMRTYFATLRGLLGERGRLLNHAISAIGGSTPGPRTFTHRYVFPDGDLLDVGDVVLAMEQAGFEVRDVESLREHYARTLRAWVGNLQAGWDEAVELVGEARARVWLLYMAASAVGFEDGGLGIHQVLGVVAADDGASGMAPTRTEFEGVVVAPRP